MEGGFEVELCGEGELGMIFVALRCLDLDL